MALKSTLSIASGMTALGALLVANTGAFAQCTVTTATNYTQVDTGCPVAGVTDTNGGCNTTPTSWQATGTLTRANPSFTIYGSCGSNVDGTSRDLDWYSFDVAEPCFVNVNVQTKDPATGIGSTNFTVFFSNTTQFANCDATGFNYTACPINYAEQGVSAGTCGLIVTTPFTPANSCNTEYTITVTARYSTFTACGTPAGGDCGHATPAVAGCQDVTCCDVICTVNPLCCDIAWDQSCADAAQQPTSLGGCGVFVYNCTNVPGAAANDCAIHARSTNLNSLTTWNNASCNTDGPNNGQCGSTTLHDVWFMTLAPSNGNMTLTANSPTQDIVLSVYGNGTTSTVDGTQLANNFIGCLDNAGIGGEAVTLTGCTAGTYYLWRIGQWDLDTGTLGAGDVTFTFAQVVFDSGVHAAICSNGTATNLGLSSGAIAAGSPQRWLAAPFTVADPDGSGSGTSWTVSQVIPEGFYPAGTTNTNMNYIVWKRSATNAAPAYATDQVASGQIVAPATLGGNGECYFNTNFTLVKGDYYLTVFASAPGNPCRANDGQAVLSNYAWFVGAPTGIALSDATGFYAWRGATQPGSGPATEVVIAGTTTACSGGTGGFAIYRGLTGVYVNCTSGVLEANVYSPSMHILGSPIAGSTCPTDLNHDNATGAADLSILLSGWGTGSPDLNGDGVVGSADLSILLNGWGACP